MKGKDKGIQVATFLHIIGREAQRVFQSFQLSENEGKDIKVVQEKFEEYCIPKSNTTMERYLLFTRRQKVGETFDEYVVALRSMVARCEFPATADSILKDCIVLGIRDEKVRCDLLRRNEDLDKVLCTCRCGEAAQSHLKLLKEPYAENQPVPVENIQATSTTKPTRERKCRFCGGSHQPRSCPAYGKVCRACGKLGHFERVCMSKNVAQHVKSVEASEGQIPVTKEMCFDTVEINGILGTKWKETLMLDTLPTVFKLDTGATASVLPLSIDEAVRPGTKPTETSVVLTGFNRSSIQADGTAIIRTTFKNQSIPVNYYISQHVASPILGQEECESFHLIQRICNATTELGNKDNVLASFSDVFTGQGTFEEPYHIQMDTGVRPTVQPPRKIPHARLALLQETLNDMKREGIITDMRERATWVNNLVVTEKKNGKMRVCLDPKALNKAIIREPFLAPALEYVQSKLAGKKVFTVLDQSSSFWQVKLTHESSNLCTFNTPWGRMRFLRMPFGITSASDILQRRNHETFGDIENTYIMVDDMIIAGETEEEHDRTLAAVLKRARDKGVKFNPSKIQYRVSEVKYMGHIIGANGVRIDPDKVRAITSFPTPTNPRQLKRLLGMVNFLAQYLSDESATVAPLRQLLKDGTDWQWHEEQEAAFQAIKNKLSSAPVLKLFDPNEGSVTIQADASKDGLGACLLQSGRPVAYASKALTKTEEHYAQIEKELLAICFACQKFRQYIIGQEVQIETDHKPLEIILRKPLHEAPLRLQRMMLRLQPFQLEVVYRRGTEMALADPLSRATSSEPQQTLDDTLLIYDVSELTNTSQERLSQLREETKRDMELQVLSDTIQQGWPDRYKSAPVEIRKYWSVRDRLTILDGVLFMGQRFVVPSCMRPYVLGVIHESHQGIEKCKSRAAETVYWPGILRDISEMVEKCSTCQKFQVRNRCEPMIPHSIPEIPWTKLGSDILEFNGVNYLVIVDYTSKYPEVCRLGSIKTAGAVIAKMKNVFSRHGIPEVLISDNMPFASQEMRNFANSWQFKIVTSSPKYSQSNGKSENCVKLVKNILKKALEDKSMDPELAFLNYRNTRIAGMDFSPAQMLMSRRLRDRLPVVSSKLKPCAVDPMNDNLGQQKRQKRYYDRSARHRPDFMPGQQVMIHNGNHWTEGKIESRHETPRSYILSDRRRRSSRHLRLAHFEPLVSEQCTDTPQQRPSSTHIGDIPCDQGNSQVGRTEHVVDDPVVDMELPDEPMSCQSSQDVDAGNDQRFPIRKRVPKRLNDYHYY